MSLRQEVNLRQEVSLRQDVSFRQEVNLRQDVSFRQEVNLRQDVSLRQEVSLRQDANLDLGDGGAEHVVVVTNHRGDLALVRVLQNTGNKPCQRRRPRSHRTHEQICMQICVLFL